MKNMRYKNPKEYWNLLNRGKSKRQPDIPIESLYNFFKELSENDKNLTDTDLPEIDPDVLSSINHNINVPISGEEIFSCIKKLKNNKSSGEDNIVNEYTCTSRGPKCKF